MNQSPDYGLCVNEGRCGGMEVGLISQPSNESACAILPIRGKKFLLGRILHMEGEGTMSTQTRPEVVKPENLDIKGAQAMIKKVIRENKEWLKEMADK
jgi:hypothetical protein